MLLTRLWESTLTVVEDRSQLAFVSFPAITIDFVTGIASPPESPGDVSEFQENVELGNGRPSSTLGQIEISNQKFGSDNPLTVYYSIIVLCLTSKKVDLGSLDFSDLLKRCQ